MKKRIFVTVLSIILSVKMFASGIVFVEDLAHIATSIENGLTMFNQLKTDAEMLANTIKQIKMLEQQMKSYDWQSYFENGEWDAFLHAADDFMSMQDKMDSLINRKSMKIGKMSFSLKDLYKTDFMFKCLNEAEQNLDPRAISEEESRQFVARHGMSYDHYMKWLNLESQINIKTKEAIATEEEFDKTKANLTKAIDGIEVKTESEKAALDANNTLQKSNAQAALISIDILGSIKDSLANIGQHEVLEHDLVLHNQQQVQEAKERYDQTLHTARYAAKDDGYLHLYPTQPVMNADGTIDESKANQYNWKQVINNSGN